MYFEKKGYNRNFLKILKGTGKMKKLFEKIFYCISNNLVEENNDEYMRWFKTEYRKEYENLKKAFGKVTREDLVSFLEKENNRK